MEKPAPEGIIQSTEQPTADLHKGVTESLRQLGHSGPTIPAQDAPALTQEVQQWAEDITHTAQSALKEAVTGGVTHIRVAESKKPLLIARFRDSLRNRLLRKKAA